jgi:hypothetical protein
MLTVNQAYIYSHCCKFACAQLRNNYYVAAVTVTYYLRNNAMINN